MLKSPPNKPMVEQIKTPTPLAIQSSLREGYQNIQWWWRQLLTLLPDQTLLKQTAFDQEAMDLRRDNFPVHSFELSVSIGLSDLPDVFMSRINYALSVRKFSDDLYALLIHPHPEDCEPRSMIQGRLIRRYLMPPSRHLLSQINAQTTENLDELRSLTIRHNGLDKTQRLRTTSIRFSPQAKCIRSIIQTATDESYFPRPTPRQSKHKPQQLFEVSIAENSQINYRFNYLISTHNPRGLRAQTASQTVSYLTHQPLYLPQAILNACSFIPAVSVP